MSELDVPGAKLRYDLTGDGPLVVFVAGAGGNGQLFAAAARHLESRFSVITYDRRGFAGSTLDGEQDYAVRIQTDASDIAALIEASGRGPAAVFGSSSGGLVTLQFMADHPDSFSRVLVHEPPALAILPDPTEAFAGLDATYAAYHAQGMQAALGGFVSEQMAESDAQFLRASAGHGDPAQRGKDMDYWFERELRQYPRTVFDWDGLASDADRLTMVVGEEMQRKPPFMLAHVVAKRLGAPVASVPGGHLCYATKPEAFADGLAALIV